MNSGLAYLTEVEKKISNMSSEEFLSIFGAELEWYEKYSWNMDDERFTNKLNEIIDKIYQENNFQVGYYTVGSDEDNEDYDYLESLELYLEDYTKSYSIPVDFFEDENQTFARISIPFKYRDNIYILVHEQDQNSCIGLKHIVNTDLIPEKEKIVDLMNMEGK